MTKARREAAMTQMAEARKRAVAVRGEARTAFVKILSKLNLISTGCRGQDFGGLAMQVQYNDEKECRD